MGAERKTHTSWQVKKRYNDKAYKRYTALLRKYPSADGADDSHLIDYINRKNYSATDYMRRGIEAYMEDDGEL